MRLSEVRVRDRSKAIIFAGQLAFLVTLSGCSTLPGSYKSQLADHLTATGAKMYGTYWCPYCAAQKEEFNGVVDRIPYVECDPQGYDAQPELCAQLGIEAYPTWIIEGDRYLGAQPLGRLAVLSGFEGADSEPFAEDPAFEGSRYSTPN
ncbi:MAG: thioredoxin family protein [Phormidesmis sp.]